MTEVRLHVVAASPTDGSPVVLPHGFPEFSFAWRCQIGPLAKAGFHGLAEGAALAASKNGTQ